MENAMFPMEILRVTQGTNVGSHLGSKAMDFGGKDGGKDKVYAPFSGIVKRTRQNANGELYLQSDGKVMCADGVARQLTATFVHDSSFNVKEGSYVRQGDYIYDEGGMGGGNPSAFANHLHLEISEGLQSSQVATSYKYGGKPVYITPNQLDINKVLMLGSDVVIDKSGGYDWKYRKDIVNKPNNETSAICFNGIDVSKYQGEIDWQKVKSTGCKFAFIRLAWCNYDGTITEGKDPYFEKNIVNAINAGINVGIYVYSYCKTTDAARICARTTNNMIKNYKLTMPVAFDYEDSKLYSGFSKQANVNICKAYLDTIKSLGYMPMLYTYTNFINSYLDMSQLSDYELWLADYRASAGYNGSYGIWQYTSSGSVDGISGRVDMNYAYKDYPALISDNGGNNVEQLSNVYLKVNEVNGRNPNQYFSTTNVDNSIGYIDIGEYKAIEKLSASENGFWWVKFSYKDGNEYWAVYDNGDNGVIKDGRAVLITKIPSEPSVPVEPPVVPPVPPVTDSAIDSLIKQLDSLTAEIKAAMAAKAQIETELTQVKKELESSKTECLTYKNKVEAAKKEAQDIISALQ